nr:MAG TPA: hypothetical protein [Caudoviricetes sp.]DAX09646.1 MAG TPA: hypothetical protein [Bacteriophage sp.]
MSRYFLLQLQHFCAIIKLLHKGGTKHDCW